MTKPKVHKCIFFFLIFISTSAFSQVNPAYQQDAYEPDSLFAVRNAIKIDPVKIVLGDLRLYYERILNGGFSTELSGGITRRNYAAGWFEYSLDNFGKNVDIQTGYVFGISVRKYLRESQELIGPYISAGVDFKKYNTSFSVIDTTGSLTGHSYDDTRRSTWYMLNFGYQALPLQSNIFADFYVGISLVGKDYDIVTADDIYDFNTYYITEKDEYSIGFQVGVKIGVGF